MKKKKNFIDLMCEKFIEKNNRTNCNKYGVPSFSGPPSKSTCALQQLIKQLKEKEGNKK